jgi:hypothetical protein
MPALNVDSYTIENGHYVGHDGFIVPKDFVEFYERFPRYVKDFVARRMPSSRHSASEREDRESDLVLHLMTLPDDSKYRMPGFNGHAEGCTDRVQIFHPDNAYGASQPRFRAYINMILLNHFISLKKKSGSNPILRYNNVALYATDPDTNETLDEDFLSRMSDSYRTQVMILDKVMDENLIVDEFREYVAEHNPELLLVLDTIGMSDTYTEAQGRLDMTEQLFMRSRNRLKVLYTCFEAKGKKKLPPRQRKVYRARAQKTNLPVTQQQAISA